jgi:hypothetical protein
MTPDARVLAASSRVQEGNEEFSEGIHRDLVLLGRQVRHGWPIVRVECLVNHEGCEDQLRTFGVRADIHSWNSGRTSGRPIPLANPTSSADISSREPVSVYIPRSLKARVMKARQRS